MSIKCHQFLLSDKREDPEKIYFLSLLVSTLEFYSHHNIFQKLTHNLLNCISWFSIFPSLVIRFIFLVCCYFFVATSPMFFKHFPLEYLELCCLKNVNDIIKFTLYCSKNKITFFMRTQFYSSRCTLTVLCSHHTGPWTIFYFILFGV